MFIQLAGCRTSSQSLNDQVNGAARNFASRSSDHSFQALHTNIRIMKELITLETSKDIMFRMQLDIHYF